MITSVMMSIISLLKQNNENIATMIVLFFLCLIGLACNYSGWIRVVSAMYGIVWFG